MHCEVSIQNSKGYIGVIYRSPSQNTIEFENFLSNFEKLLNYTTLSNGLFTITLGDFNARSSVWYNNILKIYTKDITTTEGTQLSQSSSCIDLIFTDQPNLIVDNGVHPSLHSNCLNQITHCKLNLNIEYPPPYEHLIRDYNKANDEKTKKSTEPVNWEVMFINKSMHKQVCIFNETLMNIFSNFTSNKLATFDDWDPP